ncbi:MAG: ribosome-associated translation inhibitor RaiA [Minisyncoccia bacterium]
MKINLKGTGIVLTDAITDYATKKIGTLEKFVDKKLDGVIFRVEVGKTTKHHKGGDVFKAEVNVTGGGLDIYAVAEAEDLYAAIDLVEEEVQRELVQGKTRKLKLLRRGQRAIKDLMKDFPWALKRFKKGKE